MKYKVGDAVCIPGIILEVDDSEYPYKVNTGEGDFTWINEDRLLTLSSTELKTSDNDLLDSFAGQAMASYMQICYGMHVNDGYIAETEIPNLAAYAYQIASAMLEERKKYIK